MADTLDSEEFFKRGWGPTARHITDVEELEVRPRGSRTGGGALSVNPFQGFIGARCLHAVTAGVWYALDLDGHCSLYPQRSHGSGQTETHETLHNAGNPSANRKKSRRVGFLGRHGRTHACGAT
jgi:hypothetical protein